MHNQGQVQNFMKTNSNSLLDKQKADSGAAGDGATAKMINTTQVNQTVSSKNQQYDFGGKSNNFIAKHFKAVESPALMFGSRA